MKKVIIIAWRNLWRNKRRTLITVSSIFFAIRTGVLASSGPDSKVAMITGVDFAKEVEHKGLNKAVAKYYLDSTFINEYVNELDESNAEILLKYKNKYFNSREEILEELNAAGFDTVRYFEKLISNINLPEIDLEKIHNDIIVGYKLAAYLNLNIGDSLILFGQGFRGNTAIGKYKIAGFLNFPIDQLNRLSIYMPLKTTQVFLSAYDLDENMDSTFYVNYVAINSIYETSMREQDYSKILKIKDDLEEKLNDDMLTVVGWRNLNKSLVETIQIGNAKGFIFTFIFYLIIGFGVLGTVMMLVAERKREFGVMMALGMKRRFLASIVSLELIYMGLIASIAGIIASAPLIWLGHKFPMKIHGDMAVQLQNMNMEPVLILEKFGSYIFDQVLVVFIIVAVVMLYAIRKISKLKVISSLRS